MSPRALRCQAQAAAVRSLLEERGLGDHLTVSTVDAFQGAERDVILVATCRTTSERSALAFIADPKRLNVTITRARHHLLVFGL